MKKIPLLLFVLLSLPCSASVQLEIMGGLGLGTATFSPAPTTGSIGSETGALFGGGLLFGLGPLALEGNVLYGQVGYQSAFTAANFSSEVIDRIWQLQVPILLRISPVDILSVGAGPYMAFFVSDIARTTTITGSPISVLNTTTTSHFARSAASVGSFDLGATFSVRGNAELAPGVHFIADARYNLGLMDIQSLAASEVKLRTIQIMAGITLGL